VKTAYNPIGYEPFLYHHLKFECGYPFCNAFNCHRQEAVYRQGPTPQNVNKSHPENSGTGNYRLYVTAAGMLILTSGVNR
jgi:hypothetical protein